jgi:hypothetical protein
MNPELDAIVQAMIDAGESEENIASVIQAYQPMASHEPSTPKSPIAAGVMAAGAMAPGVVSMANKAAGGLKTIAKSRLGRLTPGVIALDALWGLKDGDIAGAAKSAIGSAAMSQIPRALTAIQKATEPLSGVTSTGIKWAAKPGAGPLISRGASGLSKIAGAVGIPLQVLSMAIDANEITQQMIDDPNTPPERRKLLEAMQDRHADPTWIP